MAHVGPQRHGGGFSSEKWHRKFTKINGENLPKLLAGLATKETLHSATNWIYVFPVISTINRDYLAIYYYSVFVIGTVCFL